jgi:hypothetical protein
MELLDRTAADGTDPRPAVPAPRGRRRRRAALLAGALAIAAAGGCFVLQSLGWMDEPLTFSHSRHLEEGLECADCHADYEAQDEPRPVAAGQCALCHEELDKDKPPERQVASLFAGGAFAGARVTAMTGDVIFSHSTHVSSGLACNACHEGIEQSEAVDDTLFVSMERCVSCHERAGMPDGTQCAVCHRVLDTEHPPANHDQAWHRLHGQTARADLPGAANDCRLCHTDQTCVTCHQDEKPASHNAFWHNRGHGIEAAMDRDSCFVCHRSDSCIRCHEENQPLSHKGAWSSTLETHCLSCHIPVQSESCFTCHKGTPSHALAPPMPTVPPHNAAMDCRACHGVTAPLPHVDNGDNCTFCHH